MSPLSIYYPITFIGRKEPIFWMAVYEYTKNKGLQVNLSVECYYPQIRTVYKIIKYIWLFLASPISISLINYYMTRIKYWKKFGQDFNKKKSKQTKQNKINKKKTHPKTVEEYYVICI